MATLKTAYFNGDNGSHFYITLEYDILKQDTATNTTKIKYTLKMSSQDGYSGGGSSGNGYINGGNTPVGSISSISANETVTIGTKTETITHNQDGTKTISYNASLSTNWIGSASLSGNLTLPKIDRYPMITSAPNFNDEENPTVTFTTNLGISGATVMICISTSDGQNDDIPYRAVDVSSGSYTFELTNEERETLWNSTRTSNTKNVMFMLRTQGGGQTYYSNVTRTMTIVNANPTFTFTNEEMNSKVVTYLGTSGASKVVPNASKLHFDIIAVENKNSQIATVEILHGNLRITPPSHFKIIAKYKAIAQPHTFDIPVVGNWFRIIVTDSRGNQAFFTMTKQSIDDYNAFKIKSFSFKRRSPTSSDVLLNMEAEYTRRFTNDETSVSNAQSIKYKLNNGNWTSVPTSSMTITNDKIIINNYPISNILPYNQKGKFTLKIEDTFTIDENSTTVNKGVPTFDAGDTDVQVNGDLYVAEIDGSNKVNILDNLNTKVGEWTELGSKTGNTAINLPSSFTELLCIVSVDNNSNINIPILIPYIFLTTSEQGFNGGYAGSSINVSSVGRISATTTTAKCSYAYLNGSNKLTTTVVTYYYR